MASITTLPDWWLKYGNLVRLYSQQYGVDPALVAGFIQEESAGNPNAQGAAGDNGLMQVVGGSFDPATNIQQGIRDHIVPAISTFGNDWTKVIAAYNAGIGAILKYGGIAPYQDQTYVPNVKSYWSDFSKLLGTTAPDIGPQPIVGPLPVQDQGKPTAPTTAKVKPEIPILSPLTDQLTALAQAVTGANFNIPNPLESVNATLANGILTATNLVNQWVSLSLRAFFIIIGLTIAFAGLWVITKAGENQ